MSNPTRPSSIDVEFDGRKYQVRRMDARVGSWLTMQLISKMLPTHLESQLGEFNLPAGKRGQMSEEEFYNVQNHCLGVCYVYEDVAGTLTPMAVLRPDGRFSVTELQTDIFTITMLTVHALLFNLSAFFAGGALNKIQASLRPALDQLLSSAPK